MNARNNAALPVVVLRKVREPGNASFFVETVNLEPRAYWPSWLSTRPTKRNKYTMLDCVRYRIKWECEE